MTRPPLLAVTMGDPAGIGPEICLRLLAECSEGHDVETSSSFIPIFFGDARVLSRVAARCGLPSPTIVISQASWQNPSLEVARPAVLDLAGPDCSAVTPGSVTALTGRSAYTYIEAAIDAALAGRVAAVVTGPIHKEALAAAGIEFPGHTEIFAARTGAARSCMMLTAPEVTCSFVTSHVGLRDVAGALSTERIVEVIELTHEALKRMRGRKPRLVVCGLNPHAGEHGLFGDREEERIILPAVEAACAKGMNVTGPVSPDAAFLSDERARTDSYVCMYHDQGLIPLKALAFDRAVNVTLGLPIIRTSVDHGTALDIAWQGKADASSLREAARLAARLARSEIASVKR